MVTISYCYQLVCRKIHTGTVWDKIVVEAIIRAIGRILTIAQPRTISKAVSCGLYFELASAGLLDNMAENHTVNVFWDAEAGVWVATSEDVPGLVTEADTMEALIEKLKVIVPELLELNQVEPADASIPLRVVSERIELMADFAREVPCGESWSDKGRTIMKSDMARALTETFLSTLHQPPTISSVRLYIFE